VLTPAQTTLFDEALLQIQRALASTKRAASSRETSLTITKLEEAQFWLQKSKQEMWDSPEKRG
jgi:hypothetical protein